MPKSKTYLCQCSKCYGKRIFQTQHTIETHLGADQQFLQSLPRDVEDLIGNCKFMESCITWTVQALSVIHGSCLLPHTTLDAERSDWENSKGAQLSFSRS